MNDRTILITGVTGNQGGAVAQALQGSGFRLRGLTRKPESERAAARALGRGTKLKMMAVDDIGWFGARGFPAAASLNRREIDLAGDGRTMAEAAEILTEALGRPIAFAQTPIEQVRQYSDSMASMLQWFERVGYSADIAGLEREFGRALTKLTAWARRHARPNGR